MRRVVLGQFCIRPAAVRPASACPRRRGHAVSAGPHRGTRKSAERYRKWKFDRLREEFPDGRYEAGADIGPDEWINLKIDINGTRLIVAVNGTEAPTLTETKATPSADNIGLFVDIGSESFFSDLKVTPN